VATIVDVTLHRRRVSLRRPFVTAVRRTEALDATLVEVRDSDGRSGWGEAPTSWRVTGESVESVAAAVLGPLREAVRDRSSADPDAASVALERAVVRNSSARMAVECAIYDLAAQDRGVPLHRFLGATNPDVHTDMTVSAALDGHDIDELVRTALEHVAAGFSTLKVKTGAGANDVDVLVAVRRAVGAGVALRVDANQGWSAQQAVAIIGTLEDAGVDLEFVEQPVASDDVRALAFVTAHVSTPVVADEAVWTRRDLRDIVHHHGADLINVKLAKTGGIREALALAREARDNGVGVLVGCMAETHVGVAAGASMSTVLDAPRVHDLDGGLWLARSPVVGGATYEGSRVVLSSAPGLGINGVAARTGSVA
jgi:L-Ala-D/L-Glu epimerase